MQKEGLMDVDKQREMMKLVGEYRAIEARESWLNRETRRHIDNLPLFEAMLRMAFPDTTAVIAGHHIMFMREGHPHPHEIAAADTLLFDHTIAKACWGDEWARTLVMLALEPASGREEMARTIFNRAHGTSY